MSSHFKLHASSLCLTKNCVQIHKSLVVNKASVDADIKPFDIFLEIEQQKTGLKIHSFKVIVSVKSSGCLQIIEFKSFKSRTSVSISRTRYSDEGKYFKISNKIR